MVSIRIIHKMEMQEKTIFTATPIEGGYSWTIISLLGTILNDAEGLYGERDRSFNILGVELCDQDQPMIWYPGSRDGRKDVIIQITKDCETNINKAVFQVSHEIIHCLCPKPGRHANVLEEGLATLFSTIESTKHNTGYQPDSLPYVFAMEKVWELLRLDESIIKKARMIEPDFSLMTKELLLGFHPSIKNDLLEILFKPFSEFKLTIG